MKGLSCAATWCFWYGVRVHSCQHTVSNVKVSVCIFSFSNWLWLNSHLVCFICAVLLFFHCCQEMHLRDLTPLFSTRPSAFFHLKAHTWLVFTLVSSGKPLLIRGYTSPSFSSESTLPVLCLPMVILRFTKQAAPSHLPFWSPSDCDVPSRGSIECNGDAGPSSRSWKESCWSILWPDERTVGVAGWWAISYNDCNSSRIK